MLAGMTTVMVVVAMNNNSDTKQHTGSHADCTREHIAAVHHVCMPQQHSSTAAPE
jgi:hypothetical protein